MIISGEVGKPVESHPLSVGNGWIAIKYSWDMTNYPTMAVPCLNIDDSLPSPFIIPHIVSNYVRTVGSPILTRQNPNR